MTESTVSAARRPAAAALALLLAVAVGAGQPADDAAVRELVARLDRGETEAVRKELPDAIARFQNHPGVLYLQARVATDGIEAAKLYQSVLDNYPSSEWADDALHRLYQYYYAMGLYKTAELKLQQLRKEYPASEHLAGGSRTADSARAAPPPAPAEPPPREARARAQTPAAADTSGAAPAPPAERPAAEVRTDPAGGTVGDGTGTEPPRYTLQTGAFSTSENAVRQKTMFDQTGYRAEITNRVRGGRSLYLVWVGSYDTAERARAALAEIRDRFNITPIVVER